NAQAAESGDHGIMQVSGLNYAYTVTGGEARIVEATVGGQPIEPGRVYTIACPDFLVMQSDVYLDMARPDTRYAGGTVTGVVIDAIEEAGTIGTVPGDRIVRK
nr:5'-nucleotidase C-terminal domain-containing protein [bacterium]